jgi:biotin carboxylase
VKAHSSYLGFRIDEPRDAEGALPVIRKGIGHFGEPFDRFLAMVDRPEEIRRVGGHAMIAEEIISAGEQCTIEGFAFEDEVVVYGTVDSAREGRHRSSFSRYQYPSRLPEGVRARMAAVAERLVRAADYRDAPFNMEFFWHADSDALHLLEVNTRISKSHAPLFMMVDGQSHHRVAIDLALGRRPHLAQRRGRHAVAAKFMLRTFEDGTVRRVPTTADLARLRAAMPEALVRVLVKPGTVLADAPYQDSYSFELAEIFLGADSEDALLEKHRQALELLPFDIAHEQAA